MFRGRYLKIASTVLCGTIILASGAVVARAQQPSSTTLSQRFSALRNAFRREEPSAKKSNQSQPAHRSYLPQGKSKSKEPAPQKTTQQASRGASSQAPRSSKKNSFLPRVQVTDLLPARLFNRQETNTENTPRQSQQDVQHVASRPRVGSASKGPHLRNQTRQSPSVSRKNELEDALSDLLTASPVAEENVVETDTPTELPTVEPAPQADAAEEQQLAESSVSENDASQPVMVADNTRSKARHQQTKTRQRSQIDLHEALMSDDLSDGLADDGAAIAGDSPAVAEETAEVPLPEEKTIASNTNKPQAKELVTALPDPEDIELAFESTLDNEYESAKTNRTHEAPRPAQQAQQKRTEQPVARTRPVQRKRTEASSKVVKRERSQPTRLRHSEGDVSLRHHQPIIVSHVEGPRSILVGQEARYSVTLENTGSAAAQNLSAAIRVPEWADLIDAVSSSGVVQQSTDGADSHALEWRLDELAAHSTQTLTLQLIPRSGREFELGVRWSHESVESETRVEVKEPKLEIALNGPQEVLFGAAQRYRLTLRNPGTGDAEGVAVSLIPPGSDSRSAVTHTVGLLEAGEVKEMELELTAREAGELIMQANATARGGLEAEAIKRVLCQRPQLEVDWRGPDQKYAGTESAYYFRVRNPGTAATSPVEVKVRLPEGVRFVSANDSFAVDSASGVVTWRLKRLDPNEEQFMQLRCLLDRPGTKVFDVTAQTISGELRDTKSVRTNVVALADLKLDITDPQGARPLGETVLYEIRVHNRGTTDARGISIVGLFSEGIDPTEVEGAQNSVRDGRVTFHPIKSLPAGGEILLRIRAVASEVGTHIFRAEVVCQDLEIKLAAEETTRFFEDAFQWEDGQTPYSAERASGVNR